MLAGLKKLEVRADVRDCEFLKVGDTALHGFVRRERVCRDCLVKMEFQIVLRGRPGRGDAPEIRYPVRRRCVDAVAGE